MLTEQKVANEWISLISYIFRYFIEYTIIPFIGWITLLFGWMIIRQWPKQAKRALKKSGIIYS